jgi:hypothetical protein
MNKGLSIILRNKLAELPFVEVLAGMAQTVTTEDSNQETLVKITKRFPVCDNVLGVDCEGREISLTPNSARKSIIYFEDFGITVNGREHGNTNYISSLRLVCWMNRKNLVGNAYTDVAGHAMAMIVQKLTGGNPENIDIFTRLTVEIVRIPPQDAGLFGRYTYNEADRQYLRPPFEFFALDLSCKYNVPTKCLAAINWDLKTC